MKACSYVCVSSKCDATGWDIRFDVLGLDEGINKSSSRHVESFNPVNFMFHRNTQTLVSHNELYNLGHWFY